MPTTTRFAALLLPSLVATACGGGAPDPRVAPSPATPAGEPIPLPTVAPPTVRPSIPGGALAAAGGAGTALPAGFSRQHVFLRATVGGVPALLLFDSGASATILSPRLVTQLGLAYRRRHTAFGIGEPVTGASVYDGADITLGPLRLRPETVLSWPGAGFPSYGGAAPDGVIGYDLLRSFVVVVDLANARVVAFDTSAPPPLPRRAQAVALRVTAGLPVVSADIFASARAAPSDSAIGPATVSVVIDFGAGAGVQLSRAAAARLGFPTRLRDTRLRQIVGIGGAVELPEGVADSVRIAGSSIPNAVVAADTSEISSVALADADGFVGTELLRRFAVTLDYARGRAAFEPNALLRAPFCRNAAGLCVRTELGLRGAEVVYVEPNSPASRGGIRAGNLILAVDGTSVAQFTEAEVDRLLDRSVTPLLEVVRISSQLRAAGREGPPGRGTGGRRAPVRERVSERVSELIRLPAH